MADGVSFIFETAAFTAFMDAKAVAMPLAAQNGLRAGGRVVAQAAQAAAPVLTGALRSSIRPSSRLTHSGGTWSLNIGPWGRPHLYAAKENDRTRFMDIGYAAAQGQAVTAVQAVCEKAWVE